MGTRAEQPGDSISLGNGVTIPSHWQDLRWLALTTVLSVAAAFGLGGAWGWRRILHVVSHPSLEYLAVAFAAQAVALGSYAAAYRGVVAMGGASLPAADAATLTAAGFGAHLPRGGFGFDYGFLRSRGLPPERAKHTVMLLGLLEYALLAPAAWVAALRLLAAGSRVDSSITLSWAIGVPSGAIVTFWLLHRDNQGKRVWKRLIPMLEGVRQLLRMLSRPRHWPSVVGMACYWGADIVCLWAGLRTFGDRPGAAAMLLAFATGYALSRRTMPFAGAGLIEVFLILALTWVGTPSIRAIPAVFTYRVFNIWVPTVCGYVAVRSRIRSGRNR